MSANFFDGFEPEAEFAAEAKKTIRTIRNWRNEPNGLPYMKVGGDVYIPIEEGREWLRNRIVTPNPTG